MAIVGRAKYTHARVRAKFRGVRRHDARGARRSPRDESPRNFACPSITTAKIRDYLQSHPVRMAEHQLINNKPQASYSQAFQVFSKNPVLYLL